MNDILSPKQTAILEYLRGYIDHFGYSPCVRDIQEGCGISSTSVVDYNLKALERFGYIKREREISRGIALVGRPKLRSVPVVGTISAAGILLRPGWQWSEVEA